MICGFNSFNILNEKYDDNVELYKLSSEIIDYFFKNKFNWKNPTKLKDIIKIKNYNILYDFIENFDLSIYIFDELNDNCGGFEEVDIDNYVNSGTIYIWKCLSMYYNYNKKDGYNYKNHYKDFKKSTLVHELQHAYDYYRTKGKNSYIKRQFKFNDYVNKHNFFDSERYYKLPSEIWARFTQLVNALNFNKDFKSVLNDMKDDFDFKYYKLTDKQKKRIEKELYKYYIIKKGS